MTKPLTPSALIKQYINICNNALLRHKQSLVLQEVVALLNRMHSGKSITFDVVDDTGRMLACFTTRFIDGEFTPVRSGAHSPDTRFTLSRSYLRQVVDNAQDYMQHPVKLDWDWLTGEVRRSDEDR